MSLDTAIRGLELFLSQSDHHDSIILEFIGGEPFLEIDLLNEITEYWKFALLERRHKWLGNFRISISTNGILYDDERVQRWIRKNYELLSIGITIDGTKEKHDSTRVYPDGRGSYDDVARNVPSGSSNTRTPALRPRFLLPAFPVCATASSTYGILG